MDLIKLGKKGQLSLPQEILRRVGLTSETPLLVETTADGAIVLRPAGVYPIEVYSDARIEAFLEEDTLPPALARRAKAATRGRGKG